MAKPSKSSVKDKTQGSKPNRLIGTVCGAREGLGYVEFDNHESLSLGKKDMRSVFPGDLVEAQADGVGRNGRLQGSIIRVLNRNTTELVGQFHTERGFSYVRPSNSRIAQDIHIPEGSDLGAQDRQIVVVDIIEQPSTYAPAFGRIKDILGDELSAGMEIQIALRQFDIPHEWPESVEDEADRLGSTVRTAHKAHRLDLRELPFVTIDGEDARDFDDAVYAEKTSTGWCLNVAIADVSHYVKPNSALDDEAKNRGTSVYFPEYVVPMLPEVLSNGLCSLKPKVDRLALVCEMQISRSGNITDFQFSEAVIRSHQRLTYTQVAKALVGERAEREHLSDLQVHIDELNALYQVLMAARTKRGAMEFESQEVRFEFNEQRKIQQIVPVKRNDAHRIIEECMLCANICAANFLEKNQISGLFRVHLPPAGERLAALRSYLSELGLGLGGGDEPTTADYQQLSAQIENRLDKGVIQTMVLRSQQQAVYQPENRGHFGLAYDAYAHFTSPIRRYPDLLVHRAIRSRLRSKEPSVFVHKIEGAPAQSIKRNYPYNEEVMETLGVSCSTTERRAEDATRDVAQWLKCEYLQQHLGESFMGVVSSVTKFGLFIQMVDLYVEGLIHIANLPSDYYEYDAATQRLIGRSSKRTFKTGDKAMVQVSRVDLDERQIDLVLTDRPQQAASKPASANVKSKGQPSFSNRRQGHKDASGHTGNSVKSYDASVSEKIGEKVSKKLEKPTESRNLRNRAAKLTRRSKGHTVDAKDGATVRRKNNDRSLTGTGKKSSKKPRIRKR